MSQLDRLQERIGELEVRFDASEKRRAQATALWERMKGIYPVAGIAVTVLVELLGAQPEKSDKSEERERYGGGKGLLGGGGGGDYDGGT
jgi:hypothetical protein